MICWYQSSLLFFFYKKNGTSIEYSIHKNLISCFNNTHSLHNLFDSWIETDSRWYCIRVRVVGRISEFSWKGWPKIWFDWLTFPFWGIQLASLIRIPTSPTNINDDKMNSTTLRSHQPSHTQAEKTQQKYKLKRS